VKLKSFIPFAILLALNTDNLWARSLRATAEKLGQEATQIGYALALLGLVIGGIYLALGKQDGGKKLTEAVFGVVVISGAGALIKLIRSAS
jgi:type IV secretory pathway VirB2 component (pilin)